jgi:hypothetical protein
MFLKEKTNKILFLKRTILFGDILNIKNIQKNNVLKDILSFKN